MKSLLIIISLVISTSTPALAFLSHEEEALLVYDLNRNPGKDIHFDGFRCSMRSRSCLVKFEIGTRKVGCYIERISQASDIYKESRSTGTLVLSDYAAETLNTCIEGLR